MVVGGSGGWWLFVCCSSSCLLVRVTTEHSEKPGTFDYRRTRSPQSQAHPKSSSANMVAPSIASWFPDKRNIRNGTVATDPEASPHSTLSSLVDSYNNPYELTIVDETQASALSIWYSEMLMDAVESIKEEALPAINEALTNEKLEQQTSLNETTRAAEHAIARYEFKNERGAALSMKRYKAFQANYDKSTRVIQKLQDLLTLVEFGCRDLGLCSEDTGKMSEHEYPETAKAPMATDTNFRLQKHLLHISQYKELIQRILDTTEAELLNSTDDELIDEIKLGKVQEFVNANSQSVPASQDSDAQETETC
jgi:hypothetical protein